MNELPMPWEEFEDVFLWAMQEHPEDILIPIGENNDAISIVSALNDIYELIVCDDHDHRTEAAELLIDLGELIVGHAIGRGKDAMENVIVKQQMRKLNATLDILDGVDVTLEDPEDKDEDE